ncbi:MAG: MFS transporter [Pseudomonadota bacterium]|nr:MFS transporter [Pseudomonadota bacterium]
MNASVDEMREAIAHGPMSGLQISTVAICLAINLIDGFDVLAISFTASVLAEDWQLGPEQLGLLFSSGVAGMTLASILISPIADYIGRRRTILFSLVAITLGMTASAVSTGAIELAVYRFVTGLGIGTLLPSINTMVGEFSSQKRREFAVSVMQAGFPLGATLGGFVAFGLIESFGWRGVFWVGAILSGAMIPLALSGLPESPDFLLLRRPKGALDRLNSIAGRLGLAPITALPQDQVMSEDRSWSSLTRPPHQMDVMLLCVAFFCTMAAFYFIASWTPKLLTDAGLSTSGGISGGLLLNIVGVTGGLLLGWQSSRFGVRRLTTMYLFGAICAMVLFAMINDLTLMLFGGSFVGFFVIGSMMGLYSIAPGLFPTHIRSTATGLALGFGRFGAILGPTVTGYLLAAEWSPASLYLLFAAPLLLAAFAVGTLARRAE